MDDWRQNLPPELRDLSDQLTSFVANVAEEVDPGFEDGLEKAAERVDDADDGSDRFRISFMETLHATVAAFGGAKGVAQEYYDTFRAAAAGSPVRSNIINNVMRSIQDYGEDAVTDDEESLLAIESELKRITIEELLEKLPDGLKTEVTKHLK